MKKEELFNDDFLKQFKSGDELNGFLKELQKRGIEKMLEGELDGHLDYEKHQRSKGANKRNGHSKKKVRTSFGESEILVPRDRDASFNPMIVPKRGNMVDGLENIIVSLYAKGMSVSDIGEQIHEAYGFEVSTSTISRITEKVVSDITAWQNRPLEPVYLIIWMDGIVFKVRESSKVINKTVYVAVGLRRDGKKEVLGLWLGKNESAAFWMSVLTDIRARGRGYPHYRYGQPQWLHRYDQERIPGVQDPDMRGTPDTQCIPLRGMEGQKGLHRRHEGHLQRPKPEGRQGRTRRLCQKMGGQIFLCHKELEGELGRTHRVLRVPDRDQENHLYHKPDREPERDHHLSFN